MKAKKATFPLKVSFLFKIPLKRIKRITLHFYAVKREREREQNVPSGNG
jgi:hypothetical protein